ncbi:MAG: hypothetical protein EOP92_00695 [Lysobacteraceae bacterium]|nr:MAG: hypothetical protein EOP92_00695 [Xanthomonadaceae bacterium]
MDIPAPPFMGPLRCGRHCGSNPARGGAQDARRFRKVHGCTFRKFPQCRRTRCASRIGRIAGVCFLLLTFLCTSKEK